MLLWFLPCSVCVTRISTIESLVYSVENCQDNTIKYEQSFCSICSNPRSLTTLITLPLFLLSVLPLPIYFFQEPTGIPVHRDPGTGICDFHPGPGSAGIAKNTGILNRDFINFFIPFEFLDRRIFVGKIEEIDKKC